MSQTTLPEAETRPTTPVNEPGSEWDTLKSQLELHPLNPSGWYRVVDIAENSGDLDKVRTAYDGLLKHYPNTPSAQIAYINHFLHDPKTFGSAEDLFKRFLRASPSVDLWDFYLTYVRRVNTGPQTRDVVRKSFEFALDHVGQDKASGSIWSDYLRFLKDAPASSTWEEQQKMDSLRKVYHRAVQIPLDNVESLWSELESFETDLSKTTAKKFMADLSPGYVQARTALRQLTSQYMPGLFPSAGPGSVGRPSLFLPSVPDFDASDRQLVGKWKSYLKWEMENPLAIEDKDKAILNTRIQLMYRKAVIRMRFFPEIWFMAFTWTNSIGKAEDAITLLKTGMEANPASALLHFTYAEIQELKDQKQVVHDMYTKLLETLHRELEELQADVDSANSSFSSDPPDLNNGAYNGNDLLQSSTSALFEQSSFNNITLEPPEKATELSERKTEYGLVWIMYIRFAHRAEGLKSSRVIFGKARKEKFTPWEVYEAAALLEYHVGSEEGKGIAARIFEMGMKQYEKHIAFVERYLGFLISINDKNNARALFERVIAVFPTEKARSLWERWSRFEYQNGDLQASLTLEKRIAEAYPNETPIKRFAQRHTYLGTDAIASRDLGFSKVKKANHGKSKSAVGREGSTTVAHAAPTPNKRPASPDYRKGRDGPDPVKRARPNSPPVREDRGDRGWGRRRSPAPTARREREEEKPALHLPVVLSTFIGQLPSSASFDGPIFRTEDLMNQFRNAVIPSVTRPRTPPPPPVVPAARPRPNAEYGYHNQGPPPPPRGRRY